VYRQILSFRLLSIALWCGLLLGAARAQPAEAQPSSASDRARVALLVYQNQSASDAVARRSDALSRTLRRQAESARAETDAVRQELRNARAQGTRAQARTALLERRLEEKERAFAESVERYTAELAQRDVTYARERSVLLSTGERLLQTAEGRRALDLYNAGGQENWREARQVLDSMRRLRRAMDARDSAVLYEGALNTGLETTAAVIALYEEVVALDGSNYWDWIRLSSLQDGAGNLSAAKRSAEAALRVAQGSRERSISLSQIGMVLRRQGDFSGAISSFDQALSQANIAKIDEIISGRAVAEDFMFVVQILSNAGETYFRAGNYGEALRSYTQASSILERNAPATPTFDARRPRSVLQAKLGGLAYQQGNFAQALVHYQQALTLARDLHRTEPDSVSYRYGVGACADLVAEALLALNRPAEAMVLVREAHQIAEQISSGDPSSGYYRHISALASTKVGSVFIRIGDRAAAAGYYRRAAALERQLVSEDPTSHEYQLSLVDALEGLAQLRLDDVTWQTVSDQYESMRRHGMLPASYEEAAAAARRRAEQGRPAQ